MGKLRFKALRRRPSKADSVSANEAMVVDESLLLKCDNDAPTELLAEENHTPKLRVQLEPNRICYLTERLWHPYIHKMT